MPAVDRPDEPLPLDDLDFVYELKKPVGVRPVLYILGGLTLLAVAAVVFLIGLLLPPERQSFPMFIAGTVIPTLGAFAAFGAAIGLIRSPRRVTVGSGGLAVEEEGGTRRWGWEQIGWATIGTAALSHRRQLSVYDPKGQKLVTLGDVFDDFDGLAEQVKAAIDKKPDDTAERVQGRKAKKSAVFLMLGGVAFLALAAANGVNAWGEREDARRLAAEGVETDATITRHYLYNVTPRVEYELTTPEGKTVTRDAMMRQAEWNDLRGAPTVRVRYVPTDPDNSRLVAGEVQDEFGPPGVNLLLSAGVGVMALFFLAVGVMQWSGWDIDLDSKTGRLSIKRFGTGR